MRLHSAFALGLLLSLSSQSLAEVAFISEFSPDQPGRDGSTQLIEISGEAGTQFKGVVLGIGGSSNETRGVVQTSFPIDGTFNSDGLLVTEVNDFTNPTQTIVLVMRFDGVAEDTPNRMSAPTNIFIDQDTTDTSTLIGIQDAVGVASSTALQANLFGEKLGGQDLVFTEGTSRLAFRDASVGEFFSVNFGDDTQVFNAAGQSVGNGDAFDGNPFADTLGDGSAAGGMINPTFGSSAVPEPGTCTALFAVGVAALVRRRRS